jgi:hypothetical protein
VESGDFIVKVDGLQIPPEVRQQIAIEIQGVVLRHLAGVDFKGDLGVHIPRREWLGLWLRSQKTIGDTAFQVTKAAGGVGP